MNEAFDNELLSAYLDGELSADEQARVERHLAESPAARQLLDDLRGLSTNLQSLPRRPLPADFGQRVLRRAERNVLIEGTASDPLPAPAPSALRGWRPTGRGLFWAAAAVAAALAIAWFSPPDRQPDLARVEDAADHAPTTMGAMRAAGTTDEADRSEPLLASDTAEAAPEVHRKEGAAMPKLGAAATMAAPAQNSLPAAPSNSYGFFVQESTDDNLLLIECQITPEAARDELFATLLREQNVAVEDEQSLLALADEVPAEDLTVQRWATNLAALPAEEIYVVDCVQAQLEKVLARLESDRRGVLSVEVVPAPTVPSQKHLLSYNRLPPFEDQLRNSAGLQVDLKQFAQQTQVFEAPASEAHAEAKEAAAATATEQQRAPLAKHNAPQPAGLARRFQVLQPQPAQDAARSNLSANMRRLVLPQRIQQSAPANTAIRPSDAPGDAGVANQAASDDVAQQLGTLQRRKAAAGPAPAALADVQEMTSPAASNEAVPTAEAASSPPALRPKLSLDQTKLRAVILLQIRPRAESAGEPAQEVPSPAAGDALPTSEATPVDPPAEAPPAEDSPRP